MSEGSFNQPSVDVCIRNEPKCLRVCVLFHWISFCFSPQSFLFRKHHFENYCFALTLYSWLFVVVSSSTRAYFYHFGDNFNDARQIKFRFSAHNKMPHTVNVYIRWPLTQKYINGSGHKYCTHGVRAVCVFFLILFVIRLNSLSIFSLCIHC